MVAWWPLENLSILSCAFKIIEDFLPCGGIVDLGIRRGLKPHQRKKNTMRVRTMTDAWITCSAVRHISTYRHMTSHDVACFTPRNWWQSSQPCSSANSRAFSTIPVPFPLLGVRITLLSLDHKPWLECIALTSASSFVWLGGAQNCGSLCFFGNVFAND